MFTVYPHLSGQTNIGLITSDPSLNHTSYSSSYCILVDVSGLFAEFQDESADTRVKKESREETRDKFDNVTKKRVGV